MSTPNVSTPFGPVSDDLVALAARRDLHVERALVDGQAAVDRQRADRIAGRDVAAVHGHLADDILAAGQRAARVHADVAGQRAVHRERSAVDVRAAANLILSRDREAAGAVLGQCAVARQIAGIDPLGALVEDDRGVVQDGALQAVDVPTSAPRLTVVPPL